MICLAERVKSKLLGCKHGLHAIWRNYDDPHVALISGTQPINHIVRAIRVPVALEIQVIVLIIVSYKSILSM